MGNFSFCRSDDIEEIKPVRILVVGDSGVGKSSLIQRFLGKDHDPNLLPTIAHQFSYLTYQDAKLTFIDTSGHAKRMNLVSPSLINSAQIVLLVCSNKASSITALFEWNEYLSMHAPVCQRRYLIFNKSDLASDYSFDELIGTVNDQISPENCIRVSAKYDEAFLQVMSKLFSSEDFRNTKIQSEQKTEKELVYSPLVISYE